MDRLTLSKIDEELESSEVAALRFLCRDVVNRKRLENVTDAKGLFSRLEEKGLLENYAFLSQLLQTIGRNDLVNMLRPGYSQLTETDANPMLSDYRVMLYQIHEDITTANLDKMKFLLEDKLGRRQADMCDTALDVFAEMEKKGLLSNTNLHELLDVLREFDLPLAEIVQTYMERLQSRPQLMPTSHFNMNNQNTLPQRIQPSLSVSETQPNSGTGNCVFADSDTTNRFSSIDETEYYLFNHNPRGLCVIINNESFRLLKKRAGTHEDARTLHETFTSLGFNVEIHQDLTSAQIKDLLRSKGSRNFHNDDALVVCVLSHGEYGCIFGTDEIKVFIRELTQPFTSLQAPTLAGKPKLFFIQACQGSSYQKGSLPFVPKKEDITEPKTLEADAGPVQGETVPDDADFLLGMSTVPEYRSFRSITTGSIYIQELCKQLNTSAKSVEMDDILSILTRVNRNVSKGVYMNYKQMPEPKYTLTKKVVLKYV
ncbi:caspase-8 [Periophthalmus magnuspinnatus]|uniref:caspase-8 n=1 Tax=Periophthalmus magnuspinnatus TaxID=409849 RepID=UPI00145B6DB2|nr:caspase-8 [Periophthalmus magnuspinnatus]